MVPCQPCWFIIYTVYMNGQSQYFTDFLPRYRLNIHSDAFPLARFVYLLLNIKCNAVIADNLYVIFLFRFSIM